MAIAARYNLFPECCTWWLNSPANELVVVCMTANPKPDNPVGSIYTERSKVQPNTDRPKTADPFEVQ